LEIIMLGSLRVERRGATSKIGFDHVGEDDARLGDIEGSAGQVHLVETLAAAQKFGIDRTDLVEHLVQFAEVGEELADFGVGCVRHVTDPWALAGPTDCGKISLGAVASPVDTVAVGSPAALVGLDQRAPQYLFDRRQAAREPVATFA
jgi:hypothetical protein